MPASVLATGSYSDFKIIPSSVDAGGLGVPREWFGPYTCVLHLDAVGGDWLPWTVTSYWSHQKFIHELIEGDLGLVHVTDYCLIGDNG